METITQESTSKIISTDTARVKWMTEGVEMMKFGQVTPLKEGAGAEMMYT